MGAVPNLSILTPCSAYLAVVSLVFLLTGVPHTLTGDGSAVSKPLPVASAVVAAVLLRVGGSQKNGMGELDKLLSRFGLHVTLAQIYAEMDDFGSKLGELGKVLKDKVGEAALMLSDWWGAVGAGGGKPRRLGNRSINEKPRCEESSAEMLDPM